MENIHDRLRLLRQREKLSQKALADKMGITPAYLSAMELGKKNITRKAIEKLIELFEVSADWLISGESTNGKSGSGPLIGTAVNTQSENEVENGPIRVVGSERLPDLGSGNRLLTSAQRARAFWESKELQEQLKARLDKQRQQHQKIMHWLDNQKPTLAAHRRQLEQLGWLLSDAKEFVDEQLTLKSAQTPFALLAGQAVENQTFEQIQSSITEDLEASLPLSPVIEDFIKALTAFLEAAPQIDEPEPEPELQATFQRGLSDKLRKGSAHPKETLKAQQRA